MAGVKQVITDAVTGKEVPGNVLPVPKSLKLLGKFTRERTKPSVLRSRIMLTGRPGTGKSTFVNSIPEGALVLDLEGAGATIADPNALRWPDDITKVKDTAGEIRKLFDTLIQHAKEPGMPRMIVIDTLDELYEHFRRDFMRKHELEDVGDYKTGHGKGYAVLRDEIMGYLDRLYAAGYGWMAVVHISPQVLEEGVTIPTLCVPASMAQVLRRKCEHFFRIELSSTEKLTKVVNGKEVVVDKRLDKPRRVLEAAAGRFARNDVFDDVKVRLDFDAQIPLPLHGGWAAFEQAFDKAVEKRFSGAEAA